jgi:hypothetical protein
VRLVVAAGSVVVGLLLFVALALSGGVFAIGSAASANKPGIMRYSLSAAVTYEGHTYRGTAQQELRYQPALIQFPQNDSVYLGVRGDAVEIDLPGPATAVVLMDTRGYRYVSLLIGACNLLVSHARTNDERYREHAAAISAFKGSCHVSKTGQAVKDLGVPRIAYFADANDPKTMDLESGVAFDSFDLTTTAAPLTTNLAQRLTWLAKATPKSTFGKVRASDFTSPEYVHG